MKYESITIPEPIALDDSLVLEGDAMNVLTRLPRQSVQCVVTSPPYWGLRDYGIAGQIGLEETLPQFINRLVSVFAETRRVLRDDGVLWLNIGDGYTSGNRGYRAPDKKNPARAMSVRPDTPEGLKPNAMPESVKDRPGRSHEYLFMLTKSERYFYDNKAAMEPAVNGTVRNRRSVWSVHTQATEHAHYAVFPPALIEPCVLSTTHPGDFVLDPFFGSGTVGLVCQKNDRRFVGIELNPAYADLAVERLGALTHRVVRLRAA